MNKYLEEKIFKVLMLSSALFVAGSLLYIFLTILFKGLSALSIEMLISPPKGGYALGNGGGILNAILGSLILSISATFIAILVSLPIACYLNTKLSQTSRLALVLRFMLDVLCGIPSIVYGAFGFTIMIFFHLTSSLLAAIIAVAILITPLMTRGMDEVLRIIPKDLKDSTLALGTTNYELIQVICRQVFPGLLTAVLLAFGRGIGDAAVALFTAGFTDSLPTSLFKPVATLPLAIFFQLGTPFPEVQQRGYAAAFVLTVITLLISIAARVLMQKYNRYVNR